jgi:hypothetical protein
MRDKFAASSVANTDSNSDSDSNSCANTEADPLCRTGLLASRLVEKWSIG